MGIKQINTDFLRGFFDAESALSFNKRGYGQIALINGDLDLLDRIAEWLVNRDYSFSYFNHKRDDRYDFGSRLPLKRIDIQEYASIERFMDEIGTCRKSRWDTWLKIKNYKHRTKKINYPIYRKRPAKNTA